MNYLGLAIIAFGCFISILAIFTRPGTSTKPADQTASGKKKDKLV